MVATAAVIDDRPSALRYPRGDGVGRGTAGARHRRWRSGAGRIMREGTTVALLSLGTRLQECMKAAEELAMRGLSTTVADARFAKPIDEKLIRRLASEHEVLITVEEGAVGGFAAQVMQFLAMARVARCRAQDPARWSCRTASSTTTSPKCNTPRPASMPSISWPRRWPLSAETRPRRRRAPRSRDIFRVGRSRQAATSGAVCPGSQEATANLWLALPIAIAFLAQMATVFVDNVMVGRLGAD